MFEISTRRLIELSALNYLRRAFSSLPAIIETVSGLIVFLISVFVSLSNREFSVSSIMMAIFFIDYSLSRHWKQQLICPWARLWPKFRLIQTVLFIFLLVIPLAIYFVTTLARFGPNLAIMVLGIQTLGTACLLGMVVQMSKGWWGGFYTVIFIALTLALYDKTDVILFLQHNIIASVSIFIVAAGYISWLIYSMLKSDDGTPGFDQDPFGNRIYNKQSATTNTKPQKQMAFIRWLLMPSDRQLNALRHPQNFWRRLFRWRISMMNSLQAAMLLSGWVIFGAFAIVLFPSWKPTLLAVAMFVGVLQPIIFMGMTCTQYLKQIPYHLMLPVRRADYFKEWMLAFSLSHLMIWIVFTIAMSMSFFMIFSRENWHLLPIIIVLSLGINIFYQGIILWLARMNPILASLFTFFSAMLMPSIFMHQFSGKEFLSWTLTIWIFIGLTLLGCIAGFDAYRRWLNTEVGLMGNGFGGWSNQSTGAEKSKLAKSGAVAF